MVADINKYTQHDEGLLNVCALDIELFGIEQCDSRKEILWAKR